MTANKKLKMEVGNNQTGGCCVKSGIRVRYFIAVDHDAAPSP
jgi:hypothetical protein